MVFVQFSVLLVVISLAAWVLSMGAERLSERYGCNFVGSIVLALVTTLPEYMFVFFAALKGHFDVAIGSAIGACSLLITLGYGSVILVATTRVSRKPVPQIHLTRATQVDAIYLLGTAVVALVLVYLGDGLGMFDAAILLALFAGYIFQHWRTACVHMSAAEGSHNAGAVRMGWLMIAMAAILVVALSERFVDSMIDVAVTVGISPVIIAIVLGPIASEMPEKLTAYFTVMRDGRLAEISICNFIGSKVNHNSLLLAMLPIIAIAAHGQAVVGGLLSTPFVLMTALSVVAAVSLARRRLDTMQGLVFLLLYGTVLWAAFHAYGGQPPTH